MLKVWGRTTSSNVMKVLWTCDEVGLTFDRVDLGGPFGGNDSPEYRQLNPNGLVPTIEDEGFVLWESNACVRYLSARHASDILYPGELHSRFDAERWMDWSSTTLAPAFLPVFFGLVRTPEAERDHAAIRNAIAKTADAMQILEARLSGRLFLLGDRLTMADIPFGPTLHRWFQLPFERPALKNVEAWYRRLAERPGFKRHIVDTPIQ